MEQQKDVTELVKLLIDSGQFQNAESLAYVLMIMDRMENQLKAVCQELQEVRNQLGEMQEDQAPLKERLTKLAKGLEKRVHSMQQQLKEMKKTLNHKAVQLIKEFRSRGIVALDGMARKVGIKDMVNTLNTAFETGLKKVD